MTLNTILNQGDFNPAHKVTRRLQHTRCNPRRLESNIHGCVATRRHCHVQL